MRILHTSDWHIGRQLYNVSLLDDQRHVLGQIVDVVGERAVDVVIVAGDVYDRSVPPAEAVALLDETVDRINAIGVPMIMIAGNHDGPERLAFGARQLARAGVHICGPLRAEPEPLVLEDAHGPVAFHSLPYADPATVRDVLGVEVHGHAEAMRALTDGIRAHHRAGWRSVVIAHCYLEGFAACESERPLSVGGAETVPGACFEGFDYVALGHLHGPQSRGAANVRYSGSILKYSLSEQMHRKSVSLIDMDAAGVCRCEQIPLRPRRELRLVEGYLEQVIDHGAADPHADDYLIVRLHDTHAILDVMSKLRTVYPNVLHIERPGLARAGERRTPARDRLHRGEMPLFRDFFEQMTGDALDEKSAQIVAGMLEEIHAGAQG